MLNSGRNDTRSGRGPLNGLNRTSPWLRLRLRLGALLGFATASLLSVTGLAQDIRGYSILKGQYWIQTGPESVLLDPDLEYSLLASVDASAEGSVTRAVFQRSDGSENNMDDLSDGWSFLETFPTQEAMDTAFPFGSFALEFDGSTEGTLRCPMEFPAASYPPLARCTNWEAIRQADASQPIVVTWSFAEALEPGDFLQVYVTQGHSVIVTTGDLGQPEAVANTVRQLVIPAGTLDPEGLYGLNIEVTRISATNATCHPKVQGVTGMVSSLETLLRTVARPLSVRISGVSSEGQVLVEARTAAGVAAVLQVSQDLVRWAPVSTNVAPAGNHVFSVPVRDPAYAFFRVATQ